MKKSILAAVSGAIFLLPPLMTAHAAGTAASDAAISDCIRVIAQQERYSARRTEGAERLALIKALGKIKMTCIKGEIEQAYKDAAKLQLAPQQASTD